MADPDLKNAVTTNNSRIDKTILPGNFSDTYSLYVIQQGSDVNSVAGQANLAAKGAYDAQVKNDEQDEKLTDYDNRITENEKDIKDLQTHAIVDNPGTTQTISGSLNVTVGYQVSGAKVVGDQVTGWTVNLGTAKTGGMNADTAYTAGSTYSQTEVQAIATGLIEARQEIKALTDVLISHGLLKVGI